MRGIMCNYIVPQLSWLEHYTDNVGVSSSNLLGTTDKSEKQNENDKSLFFTFILTLLYTGSLAQLARVC